MSSEPDIKRQKIDTESDTKLEKIEIVQDRPVNSNFAVPAVPKIVYS